MTIKNESIDYKHEIVRKSIHLCSLTIPVIYYFVTKELALSVLVPFTLFSLLFDSARFIFPKFAKVYYKVFGFMLRAHEKDNNIKTLNGATWVLISATLTVAIFPKIIMITGFSILIISDLTAALIGRRFGKHKFLFKSFEGTLAFFISACLVVLITPKMEGLPLEYLIGFFAAAVGAIAENVSYGWADDNLTIPLSIGGTMWILYLYLLPQLNFSNLG